MEPQDVIIEAHEALDRMKRAEARGTGCHLTAEMIAGLGVTVVGQLWHDRSHLPVTSKSK